MIMARDCCSPAENITNAQYRKVLYLALWANLIMFGIEMVAGWHAHSSALFADAMDFLGDGINYAASLFALGLPTIWRSRVALMKGITMLSYGAIILLLVTFNFKFEHTPLASLMGIISVLALAVNLTVAWLLYRFRQGDSNMQSVWLCTRNDAIINLAVLLAAGGVWFTGQSWPDLLVALCIAGLGLSSGYRVIKRSLGELKQKNWQSH